MSAPVDPPDLSQKGEALEQALRDWWEERNDWDIGSDDKLVEDGGLWNDMPEIDSKEVTRAAPVCEEQLQIEFDPSVIRPGGYDSIDDLVYDLVPKLVEKAEGS